jgi:hypothetical protein
MTRSTVHQERQEWLGAVVLAVLEGQDYMTSAQVRRELDARVDRYLEARASAQGADHEPHAHVFAGEDLRRRTQLVRRTLRHLVATRQDVQTDLGPGEKGDQVERYRKVPGEYEETERLRRELGDARLALAQAELNHQAKLNRIRRLLSIACEHTEPDVGCPCCEAFLAAGGQFATKLDDANDLAADLVAEARRTKA